MHEPADSIWPWNIDSSINITVTQVVSTGWTGHKGDIRHFKCRKLEPNDDTWLQVKFVLVKGAYSFHTPFCELVRMIKYRVSLGKWNIYYCHVVFMGCPRHIFTCHFHSLPQICGSKVWHNETKSDISMAVCLFPLFGSILWGLYRPLTHMCNIHMDSAWCQQLQYVT